MDVDPVPGAMGQISSMSLAYGSTGETGFDDEPPLLEGTCHATCTYIYMYILLSRSFSRIRMARNFCVIDIL